MKNNQKRNFTLASDITNTSVQHDKRPCSARCTPVSSTIDSSVYQPPARPTKRCPGCQQELPVSAFSVRDKRHTPDTYCKECRKAANRIRRKSNNTHQEEKAPTRCYPVITNIGQRDVRLRLILHALQTVRQSIARKQRKRCESECF